MKTNKSYSFLFSLLVTSIVMGALLLISSCKKKEEDSPDPDTGPTSKLVMDFDFLNSVADGSDYKNHVDSGGSVNYSYTTDRNLQPNSAVTFSNGYLRIPNSDSYKVEFPFTVSMWVKLSDSSSVDNRIFYSDAATNYCGYWVQTSGNGYIAFSFGNGAGSYSGARNSAISSVQLLSNRWHHVTGVYRGYNNIEVYIDGTRDLSVTYSGDAEDIYYTNAFANIGAVSPLASYLAGSVDNVRVWKKALSSDEIIAEYNRTE